MEIEDIKFCSYMDQMFKSGDRVCRDDRCAVCRDGQWEEEAVE